MARVLRGGKGLGIFPRMELFSVAIGGFGGYCIGYLAYLSTAYKERGLHTKERRNRIRRRGDEAIRELKLHEKKRDELECSLRDLVVAAEQLEEKDSALRKLRAQLVQRERNVRESEKKLS